MGCSPWGCSESDTTEQLHFDFSLSCIGEGNGNPLQCSFLENPRDREAWWAAVYGVAQSQTRLKRLSSSSSRLYPSPLTSILWSRNISELVVNIWKGKVLPSCPTLCDPHGLQNPRNSPGQNTGVGNLSLLQGIIPTQGSNPGLPHCRCILYQPSHKGISNTENSRNFSGEILLYFMMILNTNGEVSWWLWKPIFRNLTSNIVLEQHCILSVLAPH